MSEKTKSVFPYSSRCSLCVWYIKVVLNIICSWCVFAETLNSNLHYETPWASLLVVSLGMEANPGMWCGVGIWDGVIYEEVSEGEWVALMCSKLDDGLSLLGEFRFEFERDQACPAQFPLGLQASVGIPSTLSQIWAKRLFSHQWCNWWPNSHQIAWLRTKVTLWVVSATRHCV